MPKTQARHVFFFVKSITHIRPKKLSAALFLQQRAFLCFMLLSCLSLVDITLLYLGIKNIRLGPSLPAFLSPNILNVLVENYGIAPVTTPEKDIQSATLSH